MTSVSWDTLSSFPGRNDGESLNGVLVRGESGGDRWNLPGVKGGDVWGERVLDKKGGGLMSDKTADMLVSNGDSRASPYPSSDSGVIVRPLVLSFERLMVLASSIKSEASSRSTGELCAKFEALPLRMSARIFCVREAPRFARVGGSYAWYRNDLFGALKVLSPSIDSWLEVLGCFASGERSRGGGSVVSNIRRSDAMLRGFVS